MSFQKITTEQALQEYEEKLAEMGLNDSQKSLFVGLMRGHLGDWGKSFDALQGLVLETPAIATGEYLDLWVHEWRGPMGTVTSAPPDDTKPRENHVRDAVRANS